MRRASIAVGLFVALGVSACGDDGPREAAVPLVEDVFGALGEPMPSASAEQLEAFERGRELVLRRWTPEEGLGPRMNVSFCGACHESPVFGGSAPRYRDFYIAARVLDDGSFLTPDQGGIVHAYGLDAGDTRPVREDFYDIRARRNAIPFFGAGLIAEIPEESILANADPDDADGDGISGRPNYEEGLIGRFGRNRDAALEGFIRGPLNNHLGITSDPLSEEMRALLPVRSDTASVEGLTREQEAALRSSVQAQVAAPSLPLADFDAVPDPELSEQELFDILSFTMLLAAPQPSPATPESLNGEALFHELQCASCHVPVLEGPRGGVPLYSDLLLHDMGPERGDGLLMGLAESSEFRTQPLWGVAATAPYLHDGSADTLDEAIRLHGGEAAGAVASYAELSELERLDVIAFLESLGGIEQATEGLVPPGEGVPATGEAGAPRRELNAEEEALFLEGRRVFDRDVHLNEGLGPVFSGDSCRACHFDPVVGGAGPIGVNVARFGTYDAATQSILSPASGNVLGKFAVPGLFRPEAGPEEDRVEMRNPPTALGVGLIETIPDAVILANEDPDDADGDGIYGVANIVEGGRVGRFGWKAQVPTVREFIRDAGTADLGLTLPVDEGQTYGVTQDEDAFPDPEMSMEDVDALEFWLRELAPHAPQRALEPAGRQVFESVGCDGCHVPALEGSEGPVELYSNLLLHDVQPASFAGFDDYGATGRQFRTPPLWGLSQTAPYMHDGLASTIEEAILRHAGEAQAVTDAYRRLPLGSRDLLLRFLGSL